MRVKPDPRLDYNENIILASMTLEKKPIYFEEVEMKIQRKTKIFAGLTGGLVLSLIYHATIFSTLFLASRFTAPKTTQDVSIELLTPTEMAELKKEVEQENKTEVAAKNIVEQTESINDELDDSAKYLAAKNQKVEKETKALQRGQFVNGGLKAKSQQAAGKKQIAKDLTLPNNIPLAKSLFEKYDPTQVTARQAAAAPTQRGEDGQAPQTQVAGNQDKTSQNSDYLKDVDPGLQTLLNTREFKYHSYYSRIRRQLEFHWEGQVRSQLTRYFKSNRRPASLNEDKITTVILELNSAGLLVKLNLMTSSGLQELDSAAIEALRAAAPFPNPPQGLIEEDGTVKIRWDFVLEV